MELTEQVTARLRNRKIAGKCVQLKLRYSDFHTITRSRTLAHLSNSTDEIWHAVASLFEKEIPARELVVRLIGVGVSSLESAKPRQLQLFDANQSVMHDKIDRATDAIRSQFGTGSLKRGSTLKHNTNFRRTPRADDDQ